MLAPSRQAGELARIMGIMARNNINVVYSYSLISTYIAISVKDLKAAEDILRGRARGDDRTKRPRGVF